MGGMPAVKTKPYIERIAKDATGPKSKQKQPGIEVKNPHNVQLKLVEKKKIEELDPIMKERLVLKYRLKARKLARSILRRWHSRIDIQEIDSIVDLSLCEAVRRYNPSKGASFMTFMFYHLRGNLIRCVAAAANSNLVPLLDHESPDGEDNSSWMNRGVSRSSSACEGSDRYTELDEKMPDETLLKKELVSVSNKACRKLDTLEREIIDRIFVKEEQLLDIAQSLGYSRCHISRVKRRALETLFNELAPELDIDPSKRPSFDGEDEKRMRLVPKIKDANSGARRTRRRRVRGGEVVQLEMVAY